MGETEAPVTFLALRPHIVRVSQNVVKLMGADMTDISEAARVVGDVKIDFFGGVIGLGNKSKLRTTTY